MKDCFALHNSQSVPTLLMQGDPRQVVSANKAACELFGKDLSQIEGSRGGQVFDCIHSMTEEGCGKDPNCEECKIKNAVLDSFFSDQPHEDVRTVLEIKKHDTTTPYEMEVSTQKIGEFVLITISKYQKKVSWKV